MVDTRSAGQTAFALNITATNLTLNGATSPEVTQLGIRQATLGGYGEEQLSLSDRLFLTGALRIDVAPRDTGRTPERRDAPGQGLPTGLHTRLVASSDAAPPPERSHRALPLPPLSSLPVLPTPANRS